MADGRPLRDDGQYTLAVPDYLAAGGSGYAMLRGLPAENTGVVDVDALVEYLRHQRQPVRAPREARVAAERPR
jgi:5'-nucleotidase/UDP-sugar diphosphatase